VLDERIRRRDGDLPFDVRVEDGLSTLAELKAEREQHRDRVRELTLVRDSVIAEELYVLNRADLRLAGLIASEAADPPDDRHRQHAAPPPAIVDGLKITVDGADLQDLLDKRIAAHRQRAEWWKREQRRTPAERAHHDPALPEHLCEHEAKRHEWRVDVLQFIRDRLDPADAYRLGAVDLMFGELLPEAPRWSEQADDEEVPMNQAGRR
jgi:hypothetical protein